MRRRLPRDAEPACALILARVSRSFESIRAVIEFLRPPVPRGLLNALCLGVLRNYKLLGEAAASCGAHVEGPFPRDARGWLVLVAAYEAMMRKHIPLERIEAKTSVGRDALQCMRSLDAKELVRGRPRLEALSILYSQPLWVVEKLQQAEPPGGIEALLRSFQEPTPLWLRVNIKEVNIGDALERLAELGVEARPDPVLPDVVEVVKAAPGAIERLPRRLFYPQDRSAALVGNVAVNAAPRASTLLDSFSAPGNKLAHLYWRLGAAYAVAVDLSQRRMEAERRLHRGQGVSLVDYVAADARRLPLRGEASELAIVDPDCTSMGRLGHSPETRLFLEETGPQLLQRLTRLQLRSLLQAVASLKRGGRVVYSTCTLTLEENEGVVRKAMDEGGVEPIDTRPLLGAPGRIRGSQRVYPHLHRCTGGFVAALEKV